MDRLRASFIRFEVLGTPPLSAPMIAAEALASGENTPPSLAVLAGLPQTSITEIQDLLVRTAAEMGLPQVTDVESKQSLASACLGLLRSGALRPYEGADLVYRLTGDLSDDLWKRYSPLFGEMYNWRANEDGREAIERRIAALAFDLES